MKKYKVVKIFRLFKHLALMMAVAGCISVSASEAARINKPVYLNEDAQKIIGIKTVTLDRALQSMEFNAYGQALSVQPLIDLHYRYQMLSNDIQSSEAKYRNSKKISERYKNLYRYGVASTHAMQGRDLQMQVDRAAADSSRFQKLALANEARLQWGNTLADWILANDLTALQPFLIGRKTLLKIVLPADRYMQNSIETIHVNRLGVRAKAVPAAFIGASPQAESTLPGESYFFVTQAGDIKPGMRVFAWVPVANENKVGVLVPKSALLWHMGQNWVYVKNDSHGFSRRLIENVLSASEGYFVADALKPGEEIVTEGAQLLLSEEFRSQIPADNDD